MRGIVFGRFLDIFGDFELAHCFKHSTFVSQCGCNPAHKIFKNCEYFRDLVIFICLKSMISRHTCIRYH